MGIYSTEDIRRDYVNRFEHGSYRVEAREIFDNWLADHDKRIRNGQSEQEGKNLFEMLKGKDDEMLCPDCQGELTSWFCERCGNRGLIKSPKKILDGDRSDTINIEVLREAIQVAIDDHAESIFYDDEEPSNWIRVSAIEKAIDSITGGAR